MLTHKNMLWKDKNALKETLRRKGTTTPSSFLHMKLFVLQHLFFNNSSISPLKLTNLILLFFFDSPMTEKIPKACSFLQQSH
jgi:hypothetical protein